MSSSRRVAVGARGRVRAVRLGAVSLLVRPRGIVLAVVLLGLLALAGSIHLAIGGSAIPLGDVLTALLGGATDGVTELAVTEFRAPRTAAAVIAGASLGGAGAIMQTVARNPLASPDILGVTSGAALGAVAVLVVAGGGAAGLSGLTATVGLPLAAFATGTASGALVFALARRGGVSGARVILVGLGVSGLATSITTWMLTLGDVTSAAQALTWMSGSLNGKDWMLVQPVAIAAAVLLAAASLCSRSLAIASLGDDAALALGLRLNRARSAILAIAVLLASLATVVAGPLVFVALASPQIARLLVRAPTPPLVPSTLVGALFVVVSDTISAHALPTPLPVGVGTTILGAPYLIHLLLTSRRSLA